MFELLLPLLITTCAPLSVLLTLPTINPTLNKFGVTFSEGRSQLRALACVVAMMSGITGAGLAYDALFNGATNSYWHATLMFVGGCLPTPILMLVACILSSSAKKMVTLIQGCYMDDTDWSVSFVTGTCAGEDLEVSALIQVIDTIVPSNFTIAGRTQIQLSIEQAQATVSIIAALVERYLMESAAHATTTISICVEKDVLSLSALGAEYFEDAYIRQVIVRILREKGWYASFRGLNATMSPLPELTSDDS
jgi:hypothetical protein